MVLIIFMNDETTPSLIIIMRDGAVCSSYFFMNDETTPSLIIIMRDGAVCS